MSDKIKVTIYGQQTVRYKQEREIDRATYEEYERVCDEGDEGDEDVDRHFEWLIDTADVDSADEIEDVEIIPVKTASPATSK